MWQFYTAIRIALGILAFTGRRWAYLGFVLLSLLYFPAHVGFEMHPRACQVAFDVELAVFSLTNTPHILLFAVFFVMTRIQFVRASLSERAKFGWSATATLVMGALVEIGEGISGEGNCRLRDLIPDSAGVLLGAGAWELGRRVRATERVQSWYKKLGGS